LEFAQSRCPFGVWIDLTGKEKAWEDLLSRKYHANAADLLPLKISLEEQVGLKAMSRVFADSDIPLQIVGQVDSHVPYADVCALYERAARLLGDPLFGAHSGAQWGLEMLGPLGDYAASAPTLEQGLRQSTSAISFYESGSKFSIERRGDLAKFTYFLGCGHPVGRNHYTDANMGILIDVIRHYTGPDWRPVRIQTDNAKNRYAYLLEEFHEVPIESGQAALSFVFPASDLDAPNPHPVSACETLTFHDVGALLNSRPPNTMAEAVAEVVRMRLLGGIAEIEGAARHLRLGVRTLQRQLATECISYRTIVVRERYARALALLTETCFSIDQIAAALGYEHTSAFTRAFTKQHGCPPSALREFREQLRQC